MALIGPKVSKNQRTSYARIGWNIVKVLSVLTCAWVVVESCYVFPKPCFWGLREFNISRSSMVAVDPYMIVVAIIIFTLITLTLLRITPRAGRGALGLWFTAWSLLLFGSVPSLVMFWQTQSNINPVIIRVSFVFTICFALCCSVCSVLLDSRKLAWYWKVAKAFVFWSTLIIVAIASCYLRAVDKRASFLLIGNECVKQSIVELYWWPSRPHWEYSKYYIELGSDLFHVQVVENRKKPVSVMAVWLWPEFCLWPDPLHDVLALRVLSFWKNLTTDHSKERIPVAHNSLGGPRLCCLDLCADFIARVKVIGVCKASGSQ